MLENRINVLVKNIEEKRVYQYALLVCILFIAAALRIYKLGYWSMWIDEIYTINRAQAHFVDPVQVLRNLPGTLWLPVSVILTSISLNWFGVSELSARLPSVLIGIVSIPLLYIPTRKLFGVGAALFLAVLLAVSPWHLFWSQNARFYTALMLFYALAAFSFYFALERNRPILFAAFYILFYFALSERLIAAFILPVIFLYLVALWIFRFELPQGFTRKNLLLFSAPILLGLVFELFRFAASGASFMTYFVEAFGEQQVEDPARLLISIIYNIGFPIVALGTLAGLYLVLKRNRAGLFLLLSAVVPVISLVLLNPIVFTKDRYVFVTLTFWLILVAYAIREVVSQADGLGKILSIGLLLVLLADAAGANVLYYHVNNGNRRDWRTAFELVKQKSQSSDIVVAWWPEFGPFYLDREIIPYKDVRVDEVLASGQRYWFVIDSETVWGNIPIRDFVEEQGQLIDILYLRLPEDDFNLKIYLYDPAFQPGKGRMIDQ